MFTYTLRFKLYLSERLGYRSELHVATIGTIRLEALVVSNTMHSNVCHVLHRISATYRRAASYVTLTTLRELRRSMHHSLRN